MEQSDKLEYGEISKEEYDEWRYKYPELDTYQKRAKVPSQELSDYLVKELTKKEKQKKKIEKPYRYSVFYFWKSVRFLYIRYEIKFLSFE